MKRWRERIAQSGTIQQDCHGCACLGFFGDWMIHVFNQFVRGLSLSRPRATAPSSEGAKGQQIFLL
ncbi:MAG: hypothetical protein PHH84_01040 [Oscillospiraceae bacterium]|nr:hypothetical protein [Oscillospiraceae bacterium]MDD4413847.1 hypothetical protein [Oscillospiraceae bacterium]MDD4413848.1 hypothetical protein [Oscillospiraceae bacterium]